MTFACITSFLLIYNEHARLKKGLIHFITNDEAAKIKEKI
jgi:hypothetical protein